MSQPDAPRQPPEELSFEQELAEVERSLAEIKERYIQVQQDQQTQAALQEQKARIQQSLQKTPTPELSQQLQQIQERLDDLDIRLESRLFHWSSLKEPFWQIIRFGGLGIIIGWLFAIATCQNPKPTPQTTNQLQNLTHSQ